MSDSVDVKKAQTIFETLCKYLDENEWKYEKKEDEFQIECSVQGEDFPIEISIRVDPSRMLILVISHLPFVIKEEKRLDVAVAISAINDMLIDGCFDYNITSGNIFFRMSNSFIDSEIGGELFHYLIACSCHTIDEYNDKLLMLGKGMISVEQFLEKINE